MSRIHTKDSRVLLNAFSVSGQLNGWRFEHRRSYADVVGLEDAGERWQPGQINGKVTLKGPLDSADGLRSEAVAAAGVDDSVLVTVLPAGYTLGYPALMAVADVESFTADAAIKDSPRSSFTGQPDDGVDQGVLLHTLSEETADGDGDSVDNAAASTNGAVAHFHLDTFTDLTDITVTIQHSTDDSAWSDLITFTTATDATYERKAVTGTVNRYLRASWDVTDTGSARFAVAIARR